MREMIDNRITSPHQYSDLFSNLLKAREDEKDGESTFSDSDLMGEQGADIKMAAGLQR